MIVQTMYPNKSLWNRHLKMLGKTRLVQSTRLMEPLRSRRIQDCGLAGCQDQEQNPTSFRVMPKIKENRRTPLWTHKHLQCRLLQLNQSHKRITKMIYSQKRNQRHQNGIGCRCGAMTPLLNQIRAQAVVSPMPL